MSSKKMLRLIIVMAVLLVLAIGGYFAVDLIKQKQEEAELAEQASMQLFSFNADNVDCVTFETEEGNFRTEFVSGTWTLTETDYPYDLELAPYYVTVVCSYMSGLTADRKLTVEPERLETYGLTEPTVVTCYEGSVPHTLYIGNPSATQEQYYVMVPGDDTVYGIDFDMGSVLHGGTYYLRSRAIIPCHESQVTSYALERRNDHPIVLDKKDGLWHMSKPLPDGNVNSASVNSMLSVITRLEVDDFITADPDADLASYGLNKPDYTLKVGTADGDHELRFAFAPENSNDLYVLDVHSGLISIVSANTAGFLDTRPAELMNDTLLSLTFDETAALDVQVDDVHFTMELDSEDGMYLFDGTDVTALGDNALSTFRNLFNTIAKMKYEDMALDADIPEDAEAACVFDFTLTDGSKTAMTLIQSNDENLYWAMIDGEYSGFTVRRRTLTSNTGVLDFYERMTNIINNS